MQTLIDVAARYGAVRMVEQSARHDLLRVLRSLPDRDDGTSPHGTRQPHMRAVVATDSVCRPTPAAGLADLQTGGELAVCDDVAAQAIVADESLAVVSVGTDSDSAAALVRAPGMVRMVRQWAESWWEQAALLRPPAGSAARAATVSARRAGSPVNRGRTGSTSAHIGPGRPANVVRRPAGAVPGTSTITTRAGSSSAKVLEHLAAGLKDEAIGRAMGVSARTVRRRVADLEAPVRRDEPHPAGRSSGYSGLGHRLTPIGDPPLPMHRNARTGSDRDDRGDTHHEVDLLRRIHQTGCQPLIRVFDLPVGAMVTATNAARSQAEGRRVPGVRATSHISCPSPTSVRKSRRR